MAAIKALEIITPGPLTTVQDLGRFGYGRYGVPPSGGLDTFSLRMANLLVGNTEDEACLEITVMGFRARALTDLMVAITGADLEPRIDNEPIENWRSYGLKAGETLSLKTTKKGCRAYLAVGGGILAAPVLGSRSTNLSTGFGGLEGRAVKKGDVLWRSSPEARVLAETRRLKPEWIPPYEKDWNLRVIFGPQEDHFSPNARKAFLSSPFRVRPESDRTGIRLAGPEIQKKPELGGSIISEGVVSGTVQVPGDGQPIIILVETVTGGYRKIATVISADVPLLGQLKPGDAVCFREVTLEKAYEALRKQEDIIRQFKGTLR